jgi:hypothetical protein
MMRVYLLGSELALVHVRMYMCACACACAGQYVRLHVCMLLRVRMYKRIGVMHIQGRACMKHLFAQVSAC